MDADSYLYTPDLKDEYVKRLFREFLVDKTRSHGLTAKQLAHDLHVDITTVRRYVGDKGNLPKAIPNSTYSRFLKAVGSSNEEFRQFLLENPQNKDERQSTIKTELPESSEFNSSGDLSAKTRKYSPVVPENTQNKIEPQSINELELSHSSQLKPDSSDRFSTSTPHRFVRLFVYLLLLVFPLVLLTVFLVWSNQTSFFEHGIMAKKSGHHSEAIDYFKQAIEKNDERANAYYELADIHADLTDNNLAIENYRKGIAEDTQFSVRAYNNLALLLLTQGDTNATLVLLDRAQQNITTSIEKERWAQSGIILKNQAWAYWQMGLYSEAMKLITQAQEQLGPAQRLDLFPEVFCLHALIAQHTGDPSSAEQLCINRFEAYQAKQQSGAFGSTIKSIHGMTYELYLLVLKQQGSK